MFSDIIVLVAGADPDVRETILQALGSDCHVIAAQSTDDVLAHQTNSVGLLISEVKSANLDGVDLVRRWRERHPNTPVLMLADDRDVASVVEAMKNGAADCIVKPIDADELRAAALQLVNSEENSSGPSANGSSGGQRRKMNIEIPPDTSLEDLERAAVEQALVQHHGNRTHAARTLGISVRTLQRKLKAWGMPILSMPSQGLNHGFMLAGTSEGSGPFRAHAH
jgi:DNA-binding NtrC family response regulator